MRDFEMEDLKFFYAAHVQKGGEKMPVPAFEEYFWSRTMGKGVQLVYVVTEPYRDAERPVGAIFLTGNGQAFETHAEWMPWASTRDILTAALKFILAKRGEMTLMMPIPKENRKFLDHLAGYSVLRHVGSIKQFYPGGGDAVLYQSRPEPK